MPEKSKRSGSVDVTSGKPESGVASFMRPASILFVLAALAIGGLVLLYLKFRAMDAQVRRLTEKVVQVPTEEDFKALQEEWAVGFHKQQAEQHAMIMDQMQHLQHVAEATRAHLHNVETRDHEDCATGECAANSEDGDGDDESDNDMPEPVELVNPAAQSREEPEEPEPAAQSEEPEEPEPAAQLKEEPEEPAAQLKEEPEEPAAQIMEEPAKRVNVFVEPPQTTVPKPSRSKEIVSDSSLDLDGETDMDDESDPM